MIHENLVYHQSKPIRSDERLMLETSAFQSLCGGQLTLSTPLINQIFEALSVQLAFSHDPAKTL